MGGSFEDLEVWKRSKDLAVVVCREMEACRNWSLRDQIMRSAISIPSNIAEGAERATSKEFSNFLSYAKGSAGELRTQLMIASELGYTEKGKTAGWIAETREISRMLHGLRRSLAKPTKHR